jgi:hypothetical protein
MAGVKLSSFSSPNHEKKKDETMSNATQIPRQQITIANVEVHTRSRSQHPNQQTGHALASSVQHQRHDRHLISSTESEMVTKNNNKIRREREEITNGRLHPNDIAKTKNNRC